MPRNPRIIVPGTVQHIISRFVNKSHVLRGEVERREYLRRVAAVVARTDWAPLAYGLMSSHIHWELLAGTAPAASFYHPLHSGFAGWINARTHGLGPVFAGRPRSITVPTRCAAFSTAYLHNNPVRAGLVANPADSPWTSHRAILGLEPAPEWLDVERTLALCGFDASPRGRLAFHEFVLSRRGEPKDAACCPTHSRALRREVRDRLRTPVELAAPSLDLVEAGDDADGVVEAWQSRHDILALPDTPIRLRWEGHPLDVLAAVCEETGVGLDELRSHDKSQRVSSARRLALLTWVDCLHRNQIEMCAVMGMSASAASALLRRHVERTAALQPRAQRIARSCWEPAMGSAATRTG